MISWVNCPELTVPAKSKTVDMSMQHPTSEFTQRSGDHLNGCCLDSCDASQRGPEVQHSNAASCNEPLDPVAEATGCHRSYPADPRSEGSAVEHCTSGEEPVLRRLRGVDAHSHLAHFQIDSTFFGVMGVGTVVSGTVVVGTIRIGDRLWWGPNGTGEFSLAQVVSIHRCANFCSHEVVRRSNPCLK